MAETHHLSWISTVTFQFGSRLLLLATALPRGAPDIAPFASSSPLFTQQVTPLFTTPTQTAPCLYNFRMNMRLKFIINCYTVSRSIIFTRFGVSTNKVPMKIGAFGYSGKNQWHHSSVAFKDSHFFRPESQKRINGVCAWQPCSTFRYVDPWFVHLSLNTQPIRKRPHLVSPKDVSNHWSGNLINFPPLASVKIQTPQNGHSGSLHVCRIRLQH